MRPWLHDNNNGNKFGNIIIHYKTVCVLIKHQDSHTDMFNMYKGTYIYMFVTCSKKNIMVHTKIEYYHK